MRLPFLLLIDATPPLRRLLLQRGRAAAAVSGCTAVTLLLLLLLAGCPGPEPRDEPPEGVVIDLVERPEPPRNDNDINDEVEPDEVERAPLPPYVPPAELSPRPVRLRVRPEVVDAGWRPVRRHAPGTDAVRTSLANPAYVAGLLVHAAANEDAALLHGLLHPNAALALPANLARKARGLPLAVSAAEAEQLEQQWRKQWWRLRTQLYGSQGVLAWGGVQRGSAGSGEATLALILAPSPTTEPDAQPRLHTVLLLATVQPPQRETARRGQRGDPEAESPAPGHNPVRWAVLDVQTHLAADAQALASPVAARFPPDQPQPQLFPVEPLAERAGLWLPHHAEQLGTQLRDMLQLLEATEPATPTPLSGAVTTALGLGAPPDAERNNNYADAAAVILGREPARPAELAQRIRAALDDAPHMRTHKLLRIYRTWHEPPLTPNLVAESVVVLEGRLGFPRLYRLHWLAVPHHEVVPPDEVGNPAANPAAPRQRTWHLLAWEPWLTETDPETLVAD